MKFIEKYYMDHPKKKIDYSFGCPYVYDYESYSESKLACSHYNCEQCWNREIPETKEEKKVCLGEPTYVVLEEYDPEKTKELTASPWDAAPKCGMSEVEHKEMVDHPQHYNMGKREVIEEMRILFGDEAVESFCRLNAYKYLRRAEFKGNKKEDLDKAEWYMDYLEIMRGEE